jgi:hypothetical protein
MPEFDPSRLTEPEQAAYASHVARNGDADVANLFIATVRGVDILRDEGKTPVEVTALIMGDCYDAEHLTMLGPLDRHQTIILLEAMVRQALEARPQSLSEETA